MTTLRKIEIVKLPILTKALVVLLAASCVQERLIIEVCAQEYWDFEYGYKHVNQDNAEDYLFETSNTRIYSEWHDPPVTYWGPSANDVVGTITYKFEFDRPTEKIHLKASIASFNFPQPGYGGTGKGETSLWASVDNAEWVELVYNPLPFGVDSSVTYDELLPGSLAGESVIYIQALIEVWESALGAYTTAQFSRSSSAADQDIFNIKVMLIGDEIPEHHPADTNPDWSLSINEVTAYGAAWVLGNDWANRHTPEIGYATRAGFLWLNGEEYFYDSAETAPMCWVPVGADGGGARPIGFSIERSGCQPVRWPSSFADRRVKIEVKPSVETSSYAVEEVIEQGWEVSGINEDGFYDLKNRKVKWGPWLGGPAKKARTLQYELKSPVGFSGVITLSGVASFDGLKAQIRGENQIEVVGDGPPVRIILRNFNTTIYPFTFTFSTIEGVIYEVQVTQDLKKWSKIEEVKGKSAEYKFSDLRQPIVPFERNYYRVKVLE